MNVSASFVPDFRLRLSVEHLGVFAESDRSLRPVGSGWRSMQEINVKKLLFGGWGGARRRREPPKRARLKPCVGIGCTIFFRERCRCGPKPPPSGGFGPPGSCGAGVLKEEHVLKRSCRRFCGAPFRDEACGGSIERCGPPRGRGFGPPGSKSRNYNRRQLCI